MNTPFYYYDMPLLRRSIDALSEAANHNKVLVHYAIKANNAMPILRSIAAAGFGADCVSGGEIKAALEAGFPAKSIFFAGVGKRDDEIYLALEKQIGALVVESFPELRVIADMATQMKVKAPILLRLNPSVDAHTHAYISTGRAADKFGIAPKEALWWIARRAEFPAIELKGLHFHIGSQILDREPYDNLCMVVNALLDDCKMLGYQPDIVDVGGGLGISYDEPDRYPIPDFMAYLSRFRNQIKLEDWQHLVVEPGRSLTAQCGTLISSVLFVKKTEGKDFLIIDAGMTELMRPALYDACHQIMKIDDVESGRLSFLSTESLSEDEKHCYEVVGPVCESADVFAHEILLPDLQRGDLVGIRSVGAYGQVMESTYNMRPKVDEYYFDE